MNHHIFVYMVVGFFAQMIDGALGMAYGVSCNTFLLSIGMPPAIASASVHSAEVFITAISGLSHLSFGNVNRKLFLKLLIPGVFGGIVGSYVITIYKQTHIIKPIVSLYLLIMGCVILRKAVLKTREHKVHRHREPRFLIPLGIIGGFLDAIGGGGWGPIVTTTIIAQGHNPRVSIGSVNAVEFFVTFAQVATFIVTMPALISQYWEIILGLILGGVLAAPLAAYVSKKLPTRWLMALVGVLIILLSIRTFYLSGIAAQFQFSHWR